jgi:hypothetical protein
VLGLNKLTPEQLISIEKLASWNVPDLKDAINWDILRDFFFALFSEPSRVLDKEPDVKSSSDNIRLDTK